MKIKVLSLLLCDGSVVEYNLSVEGVKDLIRKDDVKLRFNFVINVLLLLRQLWRQAQAPITLNLISVKES